MHINGFTNYTTTHTHRVNNAANIKWESLAEKIYVQKCFDEGKFGELVK